MSHLSLNRKRNSTASKIRSRMVTQVPAIQDDKQNFNIDENIQENLNSIRDTLSMLKEYEKLCIQKEDYLMAQETKNKIEFLQKQQKTIQKQRGVLKQQQTIQNICREGEQEVQNFQQYWDETINNLVEQLKEIQLNFVKQQQADLQQYKEKIANEEGPKVKYTPKILEMRKNLTNLIKMRKYKEADEVKTKLRASETECEESWEAKNGQRSKVMIEKFEKKQSFDLKALRAKLQTVFNEKIKERDQKFEILLKRNRKRRIQSSKSKMKHMKESVYMRSKSQSRVVLGNSKMSSFNCSTKC